MKVCIGFILLIFSSINIAYSQNVTLDELIKLKNYHNKVKVEEFLSLKGWTFYKSTQQWASDNRTIIIYALNPVGPDNSAKCYISHFFEELSATGSIKVETSSLNKYNEYLTRIKSLKCKLIDSFNEDDFIRKISQGNTTTFVVDIRKQNYFGPNVTVYSVFVMDNYVYENEFYQVLD
jgi:hypothetical protein